MTGDLTDLVQKIDLMDRLKQRHISTPEEYEEVSPKKIQIIHEEGLTQLYKACALRMKAYGSKSYKAVGDVSTLAPGTYYLESIDEVYRRTYAIKQG